MGQKIQISHQQYSYEIWNRPDHTISRVAHRIRPKMNSSEHLLELFQLLHKFYTDLPEQPASENLSRASRQNAYCLWRTLTPRCLDLYNQGSEERKLQLSSAYEQVIISIHQKFGTQPTGPLTDPQ